ncbi:hypothetical protein A265_01103 [Zymomonas mobilis subsp. mobilis str. CP4 = NRRL B-14023]|nr:hypothetical protein A254_01102 [Zymomonas mobilis subsp. mobilis NRRL B-12526]AHJ72568.1 hypothetical protein A265_01103 [Zymomonas mobilis subsp. mobilis str. CP4 = NRRL B-14023]
MLVVKYLFLNVFMLKAACGDMIGIGFDNLMLPVRQ